MKSYLPLILLAFVFACNQQEKSSDQSRDAESEIRFKPENYSYREGRCDTTGTGQGVGVRATYTLLDGDAPAVAPINDTLRKYLTSAVTSLLDSAEVAGNPEAQTDLNAAARLFAASYRAFQKEFADAPMGGCWEVEVTGDTLFTSSRYLSFRMETYAYTGGAHPNTVTSLYTFDRQTGRPLRLHELVKDTTRLLPVVETYFRKQQGLTATQNLEAEGYFLHEGKFFLPGNVAATRTGLLFYYNPYEIAAYALGPIEFVVPYQEIKN
ncbi:DUF3298 and DUF4163 domain-containing protein [Tellurirhabdus rosea]|uniref:DUF3298 and DUF4163 domain-containing protein n=1 Tax=Tellurirhabdus rosea TaxID=2674997 RepID=UPI0022545430|nr:DUF3298 and DUF4163 domain-containing protein [Tellurirhabdus rosea]